MENKFLFISIYNKLLTSWYEQMSHDTVLYIPVPVPSSPDFIHWPYPHFTSFSTAPHVACRGQLLCQSTSCFLFHLISDHIPNHRKPTSTSHLLDIPKSIERIPKPSQTHQHCIHMPSAGHLWIRSALPGMWHTLNNKIYIYIYNQTVCNNDT